MAEFVNDTFTDSDGTLLENHTPDTGGAWSKMGWREDNSAAFSAAEIRSNRGQGVNWASDAYRNAAEPASNEYDLSARIRIANDAGGADFHYLYARMTPTGTASGDVDRYFFKTRPLLASASHVLAKVINGSVTQLASSTTGGTSDAEHDMELSVTDALKVGTVAGVVSIDSDDNDITQVGRAGLAVGHPRTNNQWMDTFVAEGEAAAGPITLSGRSGTETRATVALDTQVRLSGRSASETRSATAISTATPLSGRSATETRSTLALDTEITLAGRSATGTRSSAAIKVDFSTELTGRSTTATRSTIDLDTGVIIAGRSATETRATAVISGAAQLSGRSATGTRAALSMVTVISLSGRSATETRSAVTISVGEEILTPFAATVTITVTPLIMASTEVEPVVSGQILVKPGDA